MEQNQGKSDFIDKCTARWLFEKTGVRLYQRAIEKSPDEMRPRLEEICAQEKEHEEMLEEVIRRYGADPHAMTPSAKITEKESQGIVDVVEHDEFKAVIDALLAAELVDNANWELLIKMAERLGDTDAQTKFEDALKDEQEHLDFIRTNILETTLPDVDASASERLV